MALVSIMMPCRNAAATLPMALASLTAQSHSNWECILVDDYSDDDSRIVIERFNEPRIRFIGLEQWHGRGHARQIALEAAKGQYLCMLDADDWYYPSKLSSQVAFLESHPTVDLVSTGMAIVDRTGNLTGVRSGVKNGPMSGTSWPGLYPPPMAHGPTMIRRAAVAGATYDNVYTRAEDSDFLSQVLEHHAWAILQDITYVYAEYTTATAGQYDCGSSSMAPAPAALFASVIVRTDAADTINHCQTDRVHSCLWTQPQRKGNPASLAETDNSTARVVRACTSAGDGGT